MKEPVALYPPLCLGCGMRVGAGQAVLATARGPIHSAHRCRGEYLLIAATDMGEAELARRWLGLLKALEGPKR